MSTNSMSGVVAHHPSFYQPPPALHLGEPAIWLECERPDGTWAWARFLEIFPASQMEKAITEAARLSAEYGCHVRAARYA